MKAELWQSSNQLVFTEEHLFEYYLIIPAVGKNMAQAFSDITTHDCEAPKISIIILNWNNWRDTLECLHSLHQITYPRYHVIIVDNGSTDGSLEKISTYCADASSARLASPLVIVRTVTFHPPLGDQTEQKRSLRRLRRTALRQER